MKPPGRLGFAALLASGALAAASLASAGNRPESFKGCENVATGSRASSFTEASGVADACNGALVTDQTHGPAGAQALLGDATTGPFATAILPAGTASSRTHLWVITSPEPGVIELSPDPATASPFPSGGPPGIPFDSVNIWVSGLNGVTGLSPDGTTRGPSATGILPAGTAFDGAHLWVITSPEPGVIELSPDPAAVGPVPAGGPPGLAFDRTHTWAVTPST